MKIVCGGIVFSKVTGEVSAFYNSIENSIRCISMFWKVSLLEILRKLLSIGVENLQSTGFEATKNDLENFMEEFCNGVPICSAFHVF